MNVGDRVESVELECGLRIVGTVTLVKPSGGVRVTIERVDLVTCPHCGAKPPAAVPYWRAPGGFSESVPRFWKLLGGELGGPLAQDAPELPSEREPG